MRLSTALPTMRMETRAQIRYDGSSVANNEKADVVFARDMYVRYRLVPGSIAWWRLANGMASAHSWSEYDWCDCETKRARWSTLFLPAPLRGP